MSNVSIRMYYRHGIELPENKIFELHKMCDCSGCVHSSNSIIRKRRNAITAYAKTEAEIDKMKAALMQWTCADKYKDLPTVYYNNPN